MAASPPIHAAAAGAKAGRGGDFIRLEYTGGNKIDKARVGQWLAPKIPQCKDCKFFWLARPLSCLCVYDEGRQRRGAFLSHFTESA